MKKSFYILTILLSFNCFSQQAEFKAPDYEKIKTDIADKNSNFFYNTLLKRLKEKDTLLTADDHLHLYYGYAFQKEYNSFYRFKDEEKLMKYYRMDKLDPKDYGDIIKLCEKGLSDFPFDLKIMNFLSYVYHAKGDEALSKKTNKIFEDIVDAIISTGDGKTCETGFHVLMIGHEYTLLGLFNLEFSGQSLVGNCDYMKLTEGKYRMEGIYFNIEKMMENEMKAFGGK